jgi:beta-lactamase class A
MEQSQTGLKMIRAALPGDWKAGDKTGRNSDSGATNDIAVARPPTGGPIFIAIYTVNPAGAQESRDQLVAEVAKTAIAELRK